MIEPWRAFLISLSFGIYFTLTTNYLNKNVPIWPIILACCSLYFGLAEFPK